MTGNVDKVKASDSIAFHDTLGGRPGLWAKTEVIMGYGLHRKNGISDLDEVIFREHNMVPIGGVQYAMEKIFGVSTTQITIPSLYTLTGIGLPDTAAPGTGADEHFLTPDGEKNVIYRIGHNVCLFGVGITGSAENSVTSYKVDYRENAIDMHKTLTDNTVLVGEMLPLRYTSETLTQVDRRKYFGKKTGKNGKTGYYLKRFEQPAEIYHVRKTGEEVEDEDERPLVSPSEVWEYTNGINNVETYTEMVLKISKKDLKEWFTEIEQEDKARVNTLALYSGKFVKDADDLTDDGDYEDVFMFSKICIPTEPVSITKDLEIIYRVYGS